ncbi:hypothetical protein M9H77_28410 [Catharanthus roseus]|uniref:Uncharacterized protein n=1 Tax=Catharanthus roseus TaxID=4058 RepID=A0ACC0AGP4_CATRO|nr:hypothetical protein M9H77_28410 [Catharanthus roseus]
MPDMSSLSVSSSRSWKIKVVKEENGITLEDDWEKFRNDNNLSPAKSTSRAMFLPIIRKSNRDDELI